MGCWSDNNLEGLAIYSTPDLGEQLWKMKKNKILSVFQEDTEIEELKKSQEYIKLEDFYNQFYKNNSEKEQDSKILNNI